MKAEAPGQDELKKKYKEQEELLGESHKWWEHKLLLLIWLGHIYLYVYQINKN